MKDSTSKLKPCDPWRIGEHENWYSYQASKGLILQATGSLFDNYKKSSPAKIKYRIEVSSNKNLITDEQKLLYEKAGWTYVDSWFYSNGSRYFYVFSSPEELNAPELHTDLAEQSYTLKNLNNALRRNTVIFIIYIPAFILWFTYLWNKNPTPWLSLLNNASPIILIFFFLFIFLVGQSIKSSLSINKLKRNLVDGIPFNHNANWKKGMFWSRISLLLYASILILSLLAFFIPNSKSYIHMSPNEIAALSIVMLEDIEGTSEIIRTADSAFASYPEQTNYYEWKNSLLTPINYRSREQGKVKDKVPIHSTVTYSSSLYSYTYQVRFKAMTDNLFEDILHEESRYIPYTQIKNNDFDRLYINELPDGFHIIASRGRSIIFLDYSGDIKVNKGLEQVLKLLKELE